MYYTDPVPEIIHTDRIQIQKFSKRLQFRNEKYRKKGNIYNAGHAFFLLSTRHALLRHAVFSAGARHFFSSHLLNLCAVFSEEVVKHGWMVVLVGGVTLISSFQSPVSCLLSLVSCLLSHISCLLSHASCILSHVSFLMSYVSCLLSHVNCL